MSPPCAAAPAQNASRCRPAAHGAGREGRGWSAEPRPPDSLAGGGQGRGGRRAGRRTSLAKGGEKLPEGLRFIAFTVMVGLVLLAVLIYLMSKPMDEYTFIAGALIFTGGSGNLYDRVLNDGRVVDFILLRLGPVQTGVFNVADMLIMIGVLAVLFLTTTLGQRLISYFRPFWLVRS